MRANVSVLAVQDLSDGTVWGDLATIGRLERTLNVRLWGDEHQLEHNPRSHTLSGVWPEGYLVNYAPIQARITQSIVRRLLVACAKSTPEKVAQKANINPSIVQDLLEGVIYADPTVVARLEQANQIRLWGNDEHPQFRPPRHYAPPGAWPNGRLHSDAPPEARLAQAIVLRLQDRTRGLTPEEVAEQTGVTAQSVQAIYDGTNWARSDAIVKIETSLNIRLWGEEHRQPLRSPPTQA